MPDASIGAGSDEADQLTGNDDRQRFDEQVIVEREIAIEPDHIRRVVAEGDQADVEDDFEDAPAVGHVDEQRRVRLAAES